MTLNVRYGICCEAHKRRVISRDWNSDQQMGFISDISQISLSEHRGQGKNPELADDVPLGFYMHLYTNIQL